MSPNTSASPCTSCSAIAAHATGGGSGWHQRPSRGSQRADQRSTTSSRGPWSRGGLLVMLSERAKWANCSPVSGSHNWMPCGQAEARHWRPSESLNAARERLGQECAARIQCVCCAGTPRCPTRAGRHQLRKAGTGHRAALPEPTRRGPRRPAAGGPTMRPDMMRSPRVRRQPAADRTPIRRRSWRWRATPRSRSTCVS